MSGVLHALGGFCARRHLLVLLVWALVVGGFLAALATIGGTTNNDLSLPGTDSQAATDLLAENFAPQQNGGSPIVFHVTDGGSIDDADNTAAIQASVTNILAIDEVNSAPDPTANPAAGLISTDGSTAFTNVLLEIGNGELTDDVAQSIVDAAQPAVDAGMQVEAGGAVGAELSQPETEQSELIGILAAMVILTIAFGSVVAMGLPILMAILGLIVALGIVGMLGHLIDIATVGPTLATMIGLGVGIDYALFIVSRHLDQLRAGMPVEESTAQAVATSGGAVVFAGGTVVIALLSLAVADIPLVTSLGYACAIAVLIAVLSAITMLPALMGLVGRRITSLSVRRRRPRRSAAGPTVWERWAALVTGHPYASAVTALVLLGVLIAPLFFLRLGQEDIGVTPTDTTERQAFDLLSEYFGPGYNGPLLIAMQLDPPAGPSPEYLAQYEEAVSLKNDLESKQATLTEQASELQAEQASLEAQSASLQAQKADLEAQGAALEGEEADLRTQADELEDDEASLLQQRAELEEQAVALQARQAALQAEQDAVAAEARRLAERVAQLQAQRFVLDAEILQLDAQIATTPVGPDRDALIAQRDAKQLERDAVLAEISAAEQALRDLVPREQALREEAAALQEEAAQLQAEQAELEAEAAELRAEAADLAGQAEQLEQQAAQLQAQGDQLAAQATALEQQATTLQQEGAALQQQQAAALAEQATAEQLQADLTVELTQAGGDERGTDQRLTSVQTALRGPPEVALVGVPRINDSGTAATLTVIPTTRPADPITADLVAQVRDQLLPEATAGGGMEAHVGGSTAGNVDLAAKITDKLPLVILTVLGLSFVLLMIAFRSLLVPLQAAITNLLAAAASFGVLTACFQWGWGLGLVGLDSPYGTVPIASYVPLMMFAALFGLAMDYEVFFVSHVQHHHAAGEPARTAVRSGLASSTRVIVSAALIMICVFGSFIINPDPTIKQFGVGLSVAVFLAASMTILLAPAMLTIFGEAVFRVPAWLGRVLPHIDLEGPPPKTATPAAQQEPVLEGRTQG